MLPDHLRAYPRLPKPYAADELTRVIGELAGEG
jgi:hypothetical protein